MIVAHSEHCVCTFVRNVTFVGYLYTSAMLLLLLLLLLLMMMMTR